MNTDKLMSQFSVPVCLAEEPLWNTKWSMVGQHCSLRWGTAPVRVLAGHHSIAATRKHDKCHVTGHIF